METRLRGRRCQHSDGNLSRRKPGRGAHRRSSRGEEPRSQLSPKGAVLKGREQRVKLA